MDLRKPKIKKIMLHVKLEFFWQAGPTIGQDTADLAYILYFLFVFHMCCY